LRENPITASSVRRPEKAARQPWKYSSTASKASVQARPARAKAHRAQWSHAIGKACARRGGRYFTGQA